LEDIIILPSNVAQMTLLVSNSPVQP